MNDVSIGNDVTLRGGAAVALGRIDQYELVRELGGGGFGCVYLAKDTVAGVEVAVKGLPPEVRHNKEELENIRANFALVSRLHHPNIAAALVLHPVTKAEYASRDAMEKLRVFERDTMMVMEYAPGVTLSQWRKQFSDRKVPVDKALELVRQVAAALDYAHGEKIVHRDVKPSNVMIETKTDGSLVARVLDFGLAAEIRSSMGRVSREIRDTSGTRPYMAPEQWRGAKQGPSTDQYALAAMFCELVTGEVPFASVFDTGDPILMKNAVLNDAPELAKDLPKAVRAALAKALVKVPEERFASCAAFVDALTGKGAGSVAPAGKTRLATVLLSALAVAALIGGGWWWQERAKNEEPRVKNEALAAERALKAVAPAVVPAVPTVPEAAPAVPTVPEAAPAVPTVPEAAPAKAETERIDELSEAGTLLRTGLEMLVSAKGVTIPELREVREKKGCAQVVRAIKGFTDVSNDNRSSPVVREEAMFMIGECWRQMVVPEKNLPLYRKRAMEAYVSYAEKFPQGRHIEAVNRHLKERELAQQAFQDASDKLQEVVREVRDVVVHPRYADVTNLIQSGTCAFDRLAFSEALESWTAALNVIPHLRVESDVQRLIGKIEAFGKSGEEVVLVKKDGTRHVCTVEYSRGTRCVVVTVRKGRAQISFEIKIGEVESVEKSQKPSADIVGITSLERKPGDTKTITLPGGATMEMVWCPAGSFMMGSPTSDDPRDNDETQHKVTLTQGFWMGKYEVTQRQWESVMGENPSYFKSPTRPVEQVSWEDCQRFIQKINAEGRVTVSLPTEAQWEYACRAGSTTSLPNGKTLRVLGANNGPALDEIAWYGGNSSVGFELPDGYDVSDWKEKQYSGSKAGTHPVGQKKPNDWGLYDMIGNVWEWCADWYGRDYYAEALSNDPAGPASGSLRVLRGGGWLYDARNCRSAFRNRYEPGGRGNILGFRLVCSRP